MRVAFEDDELGKLYEDLNHRAPRYGRDLVKTFRKKVGSLAAAASELDLRSMRSLHFELSGDRAGQHSIRLNDQWRLILRIETDAEGKLVVVVEIVDYH